MKRIETRHPLGNADAFPEGLAVLREVNGRDICVLRDGDTLRACSAWCPHQYARMDGSPGEPGHIVCRYHGLRFNMVSGDCTNASGYSVEIIPLQTDSQTGEVFALTFDIVDD